MNVVLAGRYELDQKLGRGGMAEVWRGRDLVLGRRIAVKTANVVDATDHTLGDRLRREAVATAALDHPDIVTIHDAGVDGDTAFLVMELASGRTLAALLAEGPLPLTEAVRIGGRVAGALAAAHAAGIVHRDIKPANIIVDGEKITVVDFGIAAIEFQAVTSLTAPGTTLGTAEYMAPEQARAEPATSGTDMYSVGCLLTTMVAGRPPVHGGVPGGYPAAPRLHPAAAPAQPAARRPRRARRPGRRPAGQVGGRPTHRRRGARVAGPHRGAAHPRGIVPAVGRPDAPGPTHRAALPRRRRCRPPRLPARR
ncbi:serine/threonine-protein kinase [Georgenia sp. SUBG003]|uniref:serine/threonine-protein kinase n=1 Tax=Georgenia sp. SUBG003 TaxID=1497974 RepID=UPI000693FB67